MILTTNKMRAYLNYLQVRCRLKLKDFSYAITSIP